jgi:hypothetical protein
MHGAAAFDRRAMRPLDLGAGAKKRRRTLGTQLLTGRVIRRLHLLRYIQYYITYFDLFVNNRSPAADAIAHERSASSGVVRYVSKLYNDELG